MATLNLKSFEANVPIPLSFTSLIATAAPSKFNKPEFCFKTSAGALYLDPDSTEQVNMSLKQLQIQAGEMVNLKRVLMPGQPGYFVAERANQPYYTTGQANPAYVPPASNGHIPPPPAPTPPPVAPTPVPAAATSKLMACFMTSIDSVAEAQAYADRRGLKVTFTSEDVRACAITCYIETCKGGR